MDWTHVEALPGQVNARADRVYLAVHEAGHAVIGEALGIGAERGVSLCETEGGVTCFRQHREGDLQAHRIITTLAGHAATKRIVGDLHEVFCGPVDLPQMLALVRQIVEVDRLGITNAWTCADFDSDEHLALGLILEAEHAPETDEQVLAIYREADVHADQFVNMPVHRRAIDALVVELLHHDHLSHDEVRDVIRNGPRSLRACSRPALAGEAKTDAKV